MSTSFPFRKISSDLFGQIFRPYVDIVAYGKKGHPRTITMIVDTGADYTILPRREAAILGIDIQHDCTIHSTYGVGGSQTVYLYKDLHIEFGGKTLHIPVGFLDTNNVPPLLGRHQCIELFKICFENHEVGFG